MARIHIMMFLMIVELPDYIGIQARTLPVKLSDKFDDNEAMGSDNAFPTVASHATQYIPAFMTLKPTEPPQAATKQPSNTTTQPPHTTTQPSHTTTQSSHTTTKKSSRTTKEQKKEKKDEKKEEKNEQTQEHQEPQGEESSIPEPPVNPTVVAAASVGGAAAATAAGVVVAKKLSKKKKKLVDPKCVYKYDKDEAGHTHDDRYKPTEGASTSGETAPLLSGK
ncbi:uncharacterized protein [Antedon mediterranea]|uniref:uncharacterized protein n=1 Tax=Antedon mediterranea TaxID=105859 RepID=UPI003AF694A6